MRVLSLFDGISCGMMALKGLGIDIESYTAYEIDENAVKVAKHNFPEIIECGDVFKADYTNLRGKVDILIGGSPCTYWSVANEVSRETEDSGLGWDLFSQYLRALYEVKPKYFIYENNKSMSNKVRASICREFGFEPICINSALVSAQNRNRLYWVGVRKESGLYRKAFIDEPMDRGIGIESILDTTEGVVRDDTRACVCIASRGRNPKNPNSRKTGDYMEQRYEAHTDNKTNTLTTVLKDSMVAIPILSGGTNVIKVTDGTTETKNGNTYKIKLSDGLWEIRNFTVNEYKRLQTIPEWYEFPTVKTQAYRQIGNGWTVEVIKEIMKQLFDEELN